MEKQKRWQFWLIVAVVVLTLYNVLPTIFYYSNPLREPINATRAREVASGIVERTNRLESDAEAWISSFCRLLGLEPKAIVLDSSDPRLIKVSFNDNKSATLFKRFLPAAGGLISFVPAQLSLNPESRDQPTNEVIVARQVSVHLDPSQLDNLFTFSDKFDAHGAPTATYRKIVYDRLTQLALILGAPNKLSTLIHKGVDEKGEAADGVLVASSAELTEGSRLLSGYPEIIKRWYASVTQGDELYGEALAEKWLSAMEASAWRITGKQTELQKEVTALTNKGEFASAEQQSNLELYERQLQWLKSAIALVKENKADFAKGAKSPNDVEVQKAITSSEKSNSGESGTQVVSLLGYHPFIEGVSIDWSDAKIALRLYPDVQALRSQSNGTEAKDYARDKFNGMLFEEVARLDSTADEQFKPDGQTFSIALDTLTDSRSFLTLDLGYVARMRSSQILSQLQSTWQPSNGDLNRSTYPLRDWETHRRLSAAEQKLGLVVYAPAAHEGSATPGFSNDSIYVVAKGLNVIMKKYADNPQAAGADEFQRDVKELSQILQQYGFIAFPGTAFGMGPAFRDDYIFRLDDYYDYLIQATRENFVVKGSKRYALLYFSDVEQRILTLNHIEDRIQEDLLKWQEEYHAAQVDLDVTKRYLIPPPTQSPLWQNIKISTLKYFRGDDRKILKWGLDLSGGKTVRIGLRDSANKPVTNPDDLKQAVNELYTRVNKMGVAERTIRLENQTVVLDFPGSQGLSANELVKASAMYFHIVNEKFSTHNPQLGTAVDQFLQGVWNEAVVTNRKDEEGVQQIAWEHLGMNEGGMPRNEYATLLYENGLRLANPEEDRMGGAFNDVLSSVSILKGDDYRAWEGRAHPLMILFYNYALEGASLTNVQVGWDQSEGNILTFSVKRSYDGHRGDAGGSPRDDFYNWTSQFSEDRIVGTPKEGYTPRNTGWRMAVVLNGNIITTPALKAALRDNASITGRFTQREINQLAADLKAGSLSFTPRILSEQNVSAELGTEERSKSIFASFIALVLVVAAMVSYYRFGGIVASCAVLFNILIMWGVLQNLGAALTLPGIAGIVLTIGMAVDANVLVFERVREEFKISGRIASAIQAGYRKAFTAIVDSNITTIIAALILIQFDSGPVKGFAVTLIIGIISSMFTALFMTRYFFAGWVQNPANKELKMAELISNTKFDFLAQTRTAVIASLIAIAIGGLLFVDQHKTIFGMDFTGGYSLIADVVEKPGDQNYRVQAGDALQSHGATSNDVDVRQLSYPWQLRLQLSTSMEEKGHPFYQMPLQLEGSFTYGYESNPRIAWIVEALRKGGLEIIPSQLSTLEQQWTVMSGQFSDSMRNNAVYGLLLALLAILIYITIRFEFKYAVAAVVGLVHDVAITLGIIALCHKIGFPIQIDLQAVGAIMTIVGYSLNDTIIVFDRIREDTILFRKMPFHDVVNHAINVTLSRTIMTSGTTIMVLLALVLLGGHSIFGFAFIMTVGVVIGTLSSLFIASPVMLYLHDREERQAKLEAKLRHS